jgi:AraC-like DNA-binding protein
MKDMKDFVHLSKFEKTVFSGAEHQVQAQLWVVLQLSRGVAYVRSRQLNKEFPLGGLVVVPPNSPVSVLASQLGEANLRGLSIKVSSLSGLLTSAERMCLEGEAAQEYAPFHQLTATHPLAAHLNQAFQAENGLSLSTRLGFMQAFAEWLAPCLAKAATKKTDAVDQNPKVRLKEFINRLPETELISLSLGDIARTLCCCDRHASRMFHEVIGRSFRAYIAELRLKRAGQLLVAGDAKIIDVAMESGHSSLAQFNYAFKKRFRMTPSEWRDRHLSREARPPRRIVRLPVAVSILMVVAGCLALVFAGQPRMLLPRGMPHLHRSTTMASLIGTRSRISCRGSGRDTDTRPQQTAV